MKDQKKRIWTHKNSLFEIKYFILFKFNEFDLIPSKGSINNSTVPFFAKAATGPNRDREIISKVKYLSLKNNCI